MDQECIHNLLLVVEKLVTLLNLFQMHNIGFWNVRGLNSVNKQKIVKWFIHNKEAGLFGLLETKINGNNVSNISNNMLDGCSVTTNCRLHKGGRVWLLWQPSLFDVMVLQYDAQFIHAKVIARSTQQQFFITMIYAFNEGCERVDQWNKLKSIAHQCTGPWAMAGDFNTVTSPDERLGGNTRKYSRLDRFMVNQAWIDMFPDMMAHFYPEGLLDHNPCIVSDIKLGGRKNASFKYFNMWSSAPSFSCIVNNDWRKSYNGTKMFCIVKKLKSLKGALKSLNRESYSDIENKASMVVQQLDSIQQQLMNDPASLELLSQEMELLARAIKKRCIRNKVIQIEYQNGVLCKDSQSIQQAFLAYYQSLLGSRKTTTAVRNDVLGEGNHCTEEHAVILSKQVTNEEIKQVVFSISNDKAPGPDGYTSKFFKDSWDIVGPDICVAVTEFFMTGQLLTQINATNITLIPKCERPTSVKYFRPIACCNMLYKIISKLLCNRLSFVLPGLIHDNQGAIIKGRSIIENAYDTVEWDFVEQMFHGLNFPTHFTQLVMVCVKATAFTLSLNGSNFGYFKGQRGLRQGDPISPLIFTMCMEYLTRLIKFATEKWPFQYHLLCKSLKLTHLMFADDLLLFCKGNAHSVMLLMRAFSSFSEATGLNTNNTKSEIFFNGMDESSLVAWDKVTLPKPEGGMGIKKAELWNVPTIAMMITIVAVTVCLKLMNTSLSTILTAAGSERNNARINNFITRPEIVAKQVEEEARRRIKFKAGPNMDQVGLAMLRNIGL
ncbi:uncharacterized protein LOC141619463 [Silene latifolia]|uniref:uncharacterized protein LOC141619463 n=1 Tax=Silene latifolia TaxID=37657 RepID=UPI003D76AFE3